MRVKSITFLSDLKYIEDLSDTSVDIAVKPDDGHEYVVVAATQKKTLLNNEKNDFISPGDPMVIVRKLTKKIVENAIQVYAENNGYYLKFYVAHFDINNL